jgi:hypothetical protein
MRGRLPTIVVATVLLGGQALSVELRSPRGPAASSLPEIADRMFADAAEHKAEMPQRRLLNAIGRWLAAAYDLPSLQDAPRLVPAAPHELVARRYPMLLSIDAAARSEVQSDLVAIYDARERTIYVSTALAVPVPIAISVLVHEMVHHMQNEAGARFTCPEEREKLAFAAQADWLAMFGTDLATEFGIDPFTLQMRTSCFY